VFKCHLENTPEKYQAYCSDGQLLLMRGNLEASQPCAGGKPSDNSKVVSCYSILHKAFRRQRISVLMQITSKILRSYPFILKGVRMSMRRLSLFLPAMFSSTTSEAG
jgi:hypothetical protein